MKLTLRAKLLSIMMTISLVAIAQLCFMAWRMSRQKTENRQRLISGVASTAIDKIDRNLFERYGDVQAFAVSEPARSMDPARIVPFMNDMMPTYAPVYDLMIVTNAEGVVVAANTVDKNGSRLDTSAILGKSYSDKAWFKAAMKGEIQPGTSFVEDLYKDPDVERLAGTSGRVMSFTSPIRDKVTGRIVGVWSNRMSWDDVVSDILKKEHDAVVTEAEPFAFFYIVDGRGRYLDHPDRSKILAESDGHFAEWAQTAKANVVNYKREKVLPGFSGEVYGAVTFSKGFSSYPGVGWYQVVEVPSTDPGAAFNFWNIVISILISLVVGLLAHFFIGDLTRRIEGVVTRLGDQSGQIRDVTSEISSASQDLASAVTEQASALQETASSVEEMSAMVKKSAENADRSRSSASQSQEAAGRGKEAVEKMIRAIDEINSSNEKIMKQIDESNRQITDIVHVITDIANKTKVINDIVFQTKLLSFNASVEAARAGEHGKGFAVVAEEVGNLAQMSGNAAKEIADMLNSSIGRVEGIVNETKSKVSSLISEGRTKVEAGTLVARECGDILEMVVQNVTDMNHMILEISTATQEQSQGISEINRAMGQMDLVTHQNSTTSQQAANSATRLAGQAEGLFDLVGDLRAIITGEKSEGGDLAERVKNAEVSVPANTSGKEKIVKFSEPMKELPKSSSPFKKPLQKVVGGGDPLPSEDDPRFTDI